MSESSIDNVSEASIALPNKYIKDIKTKFVKSNINSPLPKVDFIENTSIQ